MVGVTASASFFVYYGRGDIHPLIAVPTALGVFAGALTGARLAPRLRAAWIRSALILLLLIIGAQMLWKGFSA
ncbi:MAG: TSUP family transporter [Anaerolineae bacterium]|nr:TSUP family transporter [Anaerolineae bacterium]